MQKLSDAEIKVRLHSLSNWTLEDDSLKRDFKFKDFKMAFDFMKQVAQEADRLDHHPDWSNSYNKVSISLTTHSTGGLTEKDFVLAKFIDRTAEL